ncbi:aminopeptidase P, N-terminal domain-containing protein [Baffinella frigidus]|nr:aminopeptidase P, N-terminal domain-containing protein [Cryptophyta sp. CCMP2293]
MVTTSQDPKMEAGWATVDDGEEAFYSQGGQTAKIPRSMHKENRMKVLALMADDALPGSLIFMAGGVQQCRDDTDHEIVFRQESNFHYLFGVAESDCFGAVSVPDGEATLFIPRLPESHALWMGAPLSHQPSRRDQIVEFESQKTPGSQANSPVVEPFPIGIGKVNIIDLVPP